MTYNQAMIKLKHLFIAFGYEASSPDLKVPWVVKRQPDGSFLTFYFKPQSIYYVRNNNAVRHFKDARSLHLEDLKSLALLSTINPTHVINLLEARTV